jgi:hypothetical protein
MTAIEVCGQATRAEAGDKNRVTMLPAVVKGAPVQHLEPIRAPHRRP